MSDPSDLSIIENARSGDRFAFRLLVERHQAFVYRVAVRILANVGDAEDVAQETFIRLWKHLDRYRPEVKLTTWLYKITTHLCLDVLRTQQSRMTKKTLDLGDSGGVYSQWPSDQAVEDEELRLVVVQMTQQLSPKQRAVFVLRDLEELDMAEISQVLAMEAGQVKSNLYYARKRIAEWVTAHYERRKEIKP